MRSAQSILRKRVRTGSQYMASGEQSLAGS
jgi:hypothetical protein